MLKKYFKYLLIVLAVGSFTACNDYLEEVNPNELGTDNYWRNLNETNATLISAYASFLNQFICNMQQEACRADIGWPGWGRPTPTAAAVSDWYFQLFNNTTNEVQQKWDACYIGVFRANQVIEGLEGLSVEYKEQEEWTTQMAEARYIRGVMHFYLYTAYNKGSIIIKDKVPVSLEDFSKPLSPASEVLAFVREDLEFAYKYLPKKYDSAPIYMGRATAGTAATVLGTSYLYEGDYANASTYFDDIINNNAYGYLLEQDLGKMFTTAGEFNSESIFEVVYTLNHKPEMGQWDEASLHSRMATQTAGNEGALTPTWLIYAYKTEEKDPLDSRNYYTDDSGLSRMRNVPLRSSAMITCVEDEQTPYYITGSATENDNYAADGWGFGSPKKHTNHDIREDGEGGSPTSPFNGWQSGKNNTTMRLSEVYLMQAECKIQEGKIADALKLMNAIRARWGLVLYGPSNGDVGHTYDGNTYDADQLMDLLMYHEKPLELGLEGVGSRWTDLRRWGVAKERFKHLSELTFYAVDYNFVNEDGDAVLKQKTSVVTDPTGSGTANPAVIDYEYDNTYINYNPDLHDWLPIPLNEISRNSSIN